MLHVDNPHPLNAGTWVSPTQWRGTLDFTQEIRTGDYDVTVNGALAIDGITAASGTGAFKVAYAGAVTTLPPLPPTIQGTSTTLLTSLSASWAPNGTGVTQYRYAIGTTPGARNVVGWTYTTATSIIRNGLSLTNGGVYYVTVQARNSAGLWSVSAVSSAVISAKPRQEDIYACRQTLGPHRPAHALPLRFSALSVFALRLLQFVNNYSILAT